MKKTALLDDSIINKRARITLLVFSLDLKAEKADFAYIGKIAKLANFPLLKKCFNPSVHWKFSGRG